MLIFLLQDKNGHYLWLLLTKDQNNLDANAMNYPNFLHQNKMGTN